MVQAALPYLAGTLLLLVIVWAYLMTRVTRLLKSQHPQTFEELGRPTPFRNSASTSLRFLKFLIAAKFRNLGDSDLSAAAGVARVFLFGYLFVFAITVGVFVVGNLHGH